ncbi:response regulator transcription factor [Niastella caeni]|uniref:Response regulator transcription factor n=1 Tax=Niastella caeni TaxID=2569763 RepID=A0A4S8HHU4_9BACT|nr:response regulator transcription factor [Niastella caeni]THU34778.1 response regulator transcription factor [Niastella caeni]
MKSLGIKVALIDDSPIIRNCMQDIISLWGYVVVLEAVNGKDLFRKLTKANAPDICITDINMPEMNGYETIAVLKEKWPEIKIIAFSIANNKKDEERALAAGAHAFVSKLSSITVLQKVLQSMKQPAKSGYK